MFKEEYQTFPQIFKTDTIKNITSSSDIKEIEHRLYHVYGLSFNKNVDLNIKPKDTLKEGIRDIIDLTQFVDTRYQQLLDEEDKSQQKILQTLPQKLSSYLLMMLF